MSDKLFNLGLQAAEKNKNTANKTAPQPTIPVPIAQRVQEAQKGYLARWQQQHPRQQQYPRQQQFPQKQQYPKGTLKKGTTVSKTNPLGKFKNAVVGKAVELHDKAKYGKHECKYVLEQVKNCEDNLVKLEHHNDLESIETLTSLGISRMKLQSGLEKFTEIDKQIYEKKKLLLTSNSTQCESIINEINTLSQNQGEQDERIKQCLLNLKGKQTSKPPFTDTNIFKWLIALMIYYTRHPDVQWEISRRYLCDRVGGNSQPVTLQAKPISQSANIKADNIEIMKQDPYVQYALSYLLFDDIHTLEKSNPEEWKKQVREQVRHIKEWKKDDYDLFIKQREPIKWEDIKGAFNLAYAHLRFSYTVPVLKKVDTRLTQCADFGGPKNDETPNKVNGDKKLQIYFALDWQQKVRLIQEIRIFKDTRKILMNNLKGIPLPQIAPNQAALNALNTKQAAVKAPNAAAKAPNDAAAKAPNAATKAQNAAAKAANAKQVAAKAPAKQAAKAQDAAAKAPNAKQAAVKVQNAAAKAPAAKLNSNLPSGGGACEYVSQSEKQDILDILQGYYIDSTKQKLNTIVKQTGGGFLDSDPFEFMYTIGQKHILPAKYKHLPELLKPYFKDILIEILEKAPLIPLWNTKIKLDKNCVPKNKQECITDPQCVYDDEGEYCTVASTKQKGTK